MPRACGSVSGCRLGTVLLQQHGMGPGHWRAIRRYPAHAVDTLSRTVSACRYWFLARNLVAISLHVGPFACSHRHVPEHGSFRAASPTRLALGCLASPKAALPKPCKLAIPMIQLGYG